MKTLYGFLLGIRGVKNAGDDLLGFQIDLDHYLDATEMFESVTVEQNSSVDHLLKARCVLRDGVALEEAKKELGEVWQSSLRYHGFEMHSTKMRVDGFDFRFITTSPNLGVTGLVEVRTKPNQTPEPTPPAVTDRADARSAPAGGVAHL